MSTKKTCMFERQMFTYALVFIERPLFLFTFISKTYSNCAEADQEDKVKISTIKYSQKVNILYIN